MTLTIGAVANSSPWPASWAFSNISCDQFPSRRHGPCLTRFTVGILCVFSLASQILEDSEQTNILSQIFTNQSCNLLDPLSICPRLSLLVRLLFRSSTTLLENEGKPICCLYASSCFAVGVSKHCRFLPICRGLAPHIFAPYLQHYDDPKSWFAHYLRVCGRAHCICKMFDQRVMRTAFECDCTSWSCICVIFVCCFTCCWCLSRDFASAGSPPPPLPPPFWCIPSRLAQDLKLAQSRNCMWSNADDQTKRSHTPQRTTVLWLRSSSLPCSRGQ